VAATESDEAMGGSGSASGTQKWSKASKGFSFITPPDGGRDAVAHRTVAPTADARGLTRDREIMCEVAMERGRTAATKRKPG
jgi:cold shock CspA family protein